MTPARFMEEISRWIDENHDNKVDEKCDDSGKGIKKGRFQIALESASIIYGRCLIREKVVTFRMVKLNLLLSIFLITK